MTDTRLTQQQIDFFNTFGYLCFPGLLADCIDRIIAEFERIWERHGGGHHGRPHDEDQRSCIVPFPDKSEYLSSLLDDPRIHDIAAGLLGEDFNYTSGDGNLYVGDTRWHSDGYSGTRIPSIKIAFYLDRVTADTGAVRVIPGSHHCGDAYADSLERSVRESREQWGVAPEEVAGRHRRDGAGGHRRLLAQHQALGLRRLGATPHVHDELLRARPRGAPRGFSERPGERGTLLDRPHPG